MWSLTGTSHPNGENLESALSRYFASASGHCTELPHPQPLTPRTPCLTVLNGDANRLLMGHPRGIERGAANGRRL
jgi:hypothetical protein